MRRWRLILKEYSPELIYIHSSKNVTADALSRLDLDTNAVPIQATAHDMAEHFALEEEDILHPPSYKAIMCYQQKENSLTKIAKEHDNYSIKHFHGTDKKYSLICNKKLNCDP